MVEYDGRSRDMFVAGGNVTNYLDYDIYPGKVDLVTFRITFMAIEI